MVIYLSLFSKFQESELSISANNVRKAGLVFEEKLNNIGNDIFYLSETPPIQGIIRASNNQGIDPLDQSNYQQWRHRLIQLFKQMLKTKPDYLSVRYIGQANDGRELVRVDRVGKKMLAVSEKNLQPKGRRPYFQKAQTLRNYQVYFTDSNG